MKIAENKSKRQDSVLDVLFSSFQKKNSTVIDLMPYKRVTNKGYVIDKENEYQAYLKIKTKDLLSMNETDLNRMISRLTSICRVYLEPIKLLSLTYLTETSDQQTFWKRKIKQYRQRMMNSNIPKSEYNKLEIQAKLASDNLRRVSWVEDNLTELTFFMVIYGKSEKDIESNVNDIVRLGGKEFNLKLIDKKNVEDLIFRLNNMNTER